MHKLSQSFLLIILSTAFLWGILSSCENEPPSPGNISLSAASDTYEDIRGSSVDIILSLTAVDRIKALAVSVNGGTSEEISVAAGQNNQDLSYTFEIPGGSVLGAENNLLFTLTDESNMNAELTVVVKTIASITVPSSYIFERDGQSSVSYSGQIERLDMLEEMKDVVKGGDAGNVVSEQTLLDMYANVGGNGNGNFSFTSTKQLKSKTFQPDLDDSFYENMFAALATASVAGNQGTPASNGTAGLITREDKGSTILVDENGREFTQLVEKGLMGSVFYHQIYNTYLTDARIGADVENVDVSEGKNYTAMEHHWDEAFGYWDPPLDFTSPWPSSRGSEDRFWSHYSNVVDNVKDGALGTNKQIMDAFLIGRTAIVNQDRTNIGAQRDVLYEKLELVAAAVAVHYINDSIERLNEGKTGELFHVLSEAWAFTRALTFSPNKKITLAQIQEIMETDFGVNGNFWNVTSAGLNKAKATLVSVYTDLEPVKDEL